MVKSDTNKKKKEISNVTNENYTTGSNTSKEFNNINDIHLKDSLISSVPKNDHKSQQQKQLQQQQQQQQQQKQPQEQQQEQIDEIPILTIESNNTVKWKNGDNYKENSVGGNGFGGGAAGDGGGGGIGGGIIIGGGNGDPEKGGGIQQHVKADFEQAIELAGYGKFHYILLAICGLVSTSEEMDVISMSFILPSAQCDLHLNTVTKGWLNSIIFIGMMTGAYAWGSVADTLGRKKVLIVISIMNGLCIVISSFTQDYWLFMLFRFLNGVALGGSGPVIWSYFAEFQPKSKRGSMLSFMAAFWTFGNLFVAGLAWLIIPSNIGFYTPYFIYNSWRIFLMVCALPSFLVAALLLYLPESPKFLIMKGRNDQALAIFRGIFVTNTGKPRELYAVKELMIDEKFQQEIDMAKKPRGKMYTMFRDMISNSKDLFVSPILKFTLISITINFTFHIGYYGLMMWFPELFNRFDEFSTQFPDRSASVCEVTNYVVNNGSHSHMTECNSHIPSSVFMESLISLAAALPANLIAILGMDKLGRKFFLIFSTISASLCSAGMYFVTNKQQNFIVSAFFTGVIACGNASLDCLITEVFPTNLRATGVAVSMVAARLGGIIGNVVISALLDMYCPAPTFIVAILLAGGGLMCLMLPNTTRTDLK